MRVLPDGALAAKDTLRTGPSISDEMGPSIVAEDGIALGVYCWLAGGSAKCCGGFRQFTLARRMA